MVPAYDHEVIWEGHGSMIKELSYQLGCKPNAIFCSVGGGGLLGGVLVGCKDLGWDDGKSVTVIQRRRLSVLGVVPIVALETFGSNCFYHSMALSGSFSNVDGSLPAGVDIVYDEANEVTLAHFNELKSKASGSLGASQPSAIVVKMALERIGEVSCVSVPDELSMQAFVSFASTLRSCLTEIDS